MTRKLRRDQIPTRRGTAQRTPEQREGLTAFTKGIRLPPVLRRIKSE